MIKSMSKTDFFTALRSSKNAEHEQGYIRVVFGFILAGFVWGSYIADNYTKYCFTPSRDAFIKPVY